MKKSFLIVGTPAVQLENIHKIVSKNLYRQHISGLQWYDQASVAFHRFLPPMKRLQFVLPRHRHMTLKTARVPQHRPKTRHFFFFFARE